MLLQVRRSRAASWDAMITMAAVSTILSSRFSAFAEKFSSTTLSHSSSSRISAGKAVAAAGKFVDGAAFSELGEHFKKGALV